MSNELNPSLPEHAEQPALDNLCQTQIGVTGTDTKHRWNDKLPHQTVSYTDVYTGQRLSFTWPPQSYMLWMERRTGLGWRVIGYTQATDHAVVELEAYPPTNGRAARRFATTSKQWAAEWAPYRERSAGDIRDYEVVCDRQPIAEPEQPWPPQVDSRWYDEHDGLPLRAWTVNEQPSRQRVGNAYFIKLLRPAKDRPEGVVEGRNIICTAEQWNLRFIAYVRPKTVAEQFAESRAQRATLTDALDVAVNKLEAGLNGTTASDLPSENKVGYEPQGMSYSEIAERNAARLLKVSTLLSTYERAVVVCATQPDPFRVYAERCDRARQAVLDACAE